MWAVTVGLLVAAGVTVFDVLNSGTVVIGTVVLAPFVVSLLTGPRDTGLVAAAAVALVLASPAWNGDFLTGGYLLRVAVVAVGGVVSVLASRAHERIAVDRARFALLAAVAEVADGRLTLEETADRLCGLIVPAFAELCVLDAVGDGGPRRLAARTAGPDAAALEAALADRPHGGLGAPAVVALRARGREVGALTLFAPGGYADDELAFFAVLAGRVALALDNAGLFTELRATEAQLTTALGSLSEAVTIQDPGGGLVYANQAAAALLGYASPQELLATAPTAIAERFDSFREDGSPLDLADLPGRRVLRGEEPEPLVVRAVDRRTGEAQWRMTKATAIRDPAGAVQLVVNVITDITAAKRAELAQRLLADAAAALASSLDYERTLQQVADLAVPALADWCSVSLPDDRGALLTVAVSHVDPAKVALARVLGERYPTSLDEPGGAAAVFRDGVARRVNGITDEMLAAAARDADHLAAVRGLGIAAALIVPMISGGRSIGVLSLVSAESGRSFSPDDAVLAGELARRAATAVENARLYTERSTIARILQAGLLPDELPELPGWRTATLYRPAGDETSVGGDFYEAFRIDGGWMLVVGDVTGRGATAAALTALMRHTLRTAATLTGSPARALAKLNDELGARPDLALCTAVCVVLREDGDGARAEITCAGHPLPLLIRDGRVEHVGRFGALLGAYAGEEWEAETIAIAPGDVLLLYSDGVLDTVGAEDRFGPDRLTGALAGAAGAEAAIRRLDAALAEFQVGRQADDTAVLGVERLPVGSALPHARRTGDRAA